MATMQRTEIVTAIAELLEECAGVNPSDIAEDKRLVDDLDIDSLAMVEIAVAVDETFKVPVTDETYQAWQTVGDIVNHVVAA
jgi:acyl carrier protein